MEKNGYGKDGIFRSLRPPLILPTEHSSLVSFLFRNSWTYADKLAVADADSGAKLCFGELKERVKQMGSGLQQLGITKGDVVLIFAPNSINFIVSFLGILSIGAVASTLNPLYTSMEVSKQVHNCNPKLLITVSLLWDKARDLSLPAVFIDEGQGHGHGSSSSITLFSQVLKMEMGKSGGGAVRMRQTDTAAILYSSGTTGMNKGVVLSHRNFIASALMVGSDQEARGERDLRWLCVLPMFHVYGLSVITFAQLQRGNAVVSMAKFDFRRMLEVIEEYKVTHLPLVPPIMIELAKQKEVEKYDLSSLKEIISGAAPLGRDIMEECAMRIPSAAILQGYGMTETCGIATMEPSKQNTHFGSAGTLVPGVESKIVNLEKGKPLPPNQKGEVWLRGPNIMEGYLNNPNATKNTLDREGWLHTGDLGYFDEVGRLFIVDRIKELIKVKGFQVAPAELEALLLTHPQIVDAAVIPMDDHKAGEVPVAYIVASSSSSLALTPQEVMDFVAKQVAPFKRLRKVTFVNTIPKSSSGKILRRLLLEKFQSKL